MRERVEKSLGALVVARQARTMCSDLERLLSDWDGTFSIPIRKRVSRHLTQCDECEERRRKLVSPIALYGAAPVLAAPLGLKDTILDAVGSFVETAEASEYKWDEDGFPEPVETNWIEDKDEVENLSHENLPASRKRLRRLGFYAFLIGGVVTLSVVLTAGGGEGPILTPEKLNETEVSAMLVEEGSEESSTFTDVETATTTTAAPVETATTTCLLYTSPSPRDRTRSRMPSSA